MTTVAHRNNILAVDSLASISGSMYPTEKFREVLNNNTYTVFTGSGDWGMIHRLTEWYLAGRNDQDYPAEQMNHGTDMPARLIVATIHGLSWYERGPYPGGTSGDYMAFGSGMDFAMGAMYQGATAIEALNAAIRHDSNTGGAVVAFDLSRGMRVQ